MDKKTYQLKNDNGLVVEFLSHGGRITSVKVPDGENFVDVVIGYDTAEEAINGDDYFGAMCGRVANRIAEGKFTLEDKDYQLAQNNGGNALHGGPNGFQTKYWDVEQINENAYKLSLTSPDGDENYPGEIKVEMIYSLNNDNEFGIDISAKTNKTTIVNLTSHPYFNLKGAGKGNILDHLLEINAIEMTPLSEKSVPTGEIRNIEGTAMDFSTPKSVKEAIESDYEQIKLVGGIDHNWVLNKDENENGFALRLTEPVSGRKIELITTQPGVQVYTAMHFDGSEKGKGGASFEKFGGIAIEAQNYPDAINHTNFPNSVLKPEEVYEQKIVYKFGW
jgi:aldose 1-epimerase